jgi:hypothetical protein
MVKNRVPVKLQAWIAARRRHRLSHAQVQMARELGMNPKKLGKLDNHKQEPWKLPLPQFIEGLYFKRFGKTQPDRVVSIEQRAKEAELKKEAKKERGTRTTGSPPADWDEPGIASSSANAVKGSSPASTEKISFGRTPCGSPRPDQF